MRPPERFEPGQRCGVIPKIVSDEIEIAAHWPLPHFGSQRVRYGTPLMMAAFLSLALIPGHYFLYEHDPSIFITLPFPVMAIILAIWGALYYDGTTLLVNRHHVTLKRWFHDPAGDLLFQLGRPMHTLAVHPSF